MSSNQNLNNHLKMEPSAEKSRRVIIFLVFFITFFMGTVFFVIYIFSSYQDKVYKDTIKNAKMNSSLLDLRNYEKEELNNYGYIDKDAGVVRIPIESAIKKVVRRYN